MTFSLTAKMGFMNAPIKGTVVVTDKDLTIDADLGFLENLITPKAKAELETKQQAAIEGLGHTLVSFLRKFKG